MKNSQRASEMRAYYQGGETLQQVGDRYGISRERVRQILKTGGVSRDEGGAALRAINRAAERKAALDNRFIKKWGHTFAEHKALTELGRGMTVETSPVGAYVSQRNNAKRRGIAWQILLEDWWSIWQESGKWHQRGRGQGKYVMSRHNDVGPYSKENVFIQLAVQNNSNRPQKKTSLPMGVRQDPYGYHVLKMTNGKQQYRGFFFTLQEAEEAYRNAV